MGASRIYGKCALCVLCRLWVRAWARMHACMGSRVVGVIDGTRDVDVIPFFFFFFHGSGEVIKLAGDTVSIQCFEDTGEA